MKKKTRTNRHKTAKATTEHRQPSNQPQPIRAHVKELKRRLFYIAISVIVCSALIYGIERQLIDILLRPSHGQKFVYTSPMGGINFLFNVCFYFGIAMSVPVIVYNVLQFLQPLMRNTTRRFILLTSISSGFIAVGGILFGYFAGLPAALHFLLKQQFHNGQVEAMISIQSYFSFVVAYMCGAALMFQLPLVLLIINRMKRLTPKKMFAYERWVIVFSFVAAFIMNPTPNVIDQMLTVVPVLVSYQFGILLVWLVNRKTTRRRYEKLFDQDTAAQQARFAQATNATRVTDNQVEASSPLAPPRQTLPKMPPVAETRAAHHVAPKKILPSLETEPVPSLKIRQPIQDMAFTQAIPPRAAPQGRTVSPRYLAPRPYAPERLLQF